jgi:hypothetical protein
LCVCVCVSLCAESYGKHWSLQFSRIGVLSVDWTEPAKNANCLYISTTPRDKTLWKNVCVLSLQVLWIFSLHLSLLCLFPPFFSPRLVSLSVSASISFACSESHAEHWSFQFSIIGV